MNMNTLARLALLSALVPLGAAGAAYKEKYLLSVSVSSGEPIDGQIYGRISPGDRWVLRIDAASFRSQDEEVMEGLLKKVVWDHGARLDNIRFETSSSTSFHQEVMAKLKDSSLPESLVVRQKSKELTAELRSIINESSLVKMICSKVEVLHARCPVGGVTMNPVALKGGRAGQTWAQLKYQQDAGIEANSLAFFIELQPE